MMPRNLRLIEAWIIGVCIVAASSEFAKDLSSSFRDTHCPWADTRPNVDGQHTVLTFDEFRDSNQTEIKINDTFNSIFLSTMFLSRGKYTFKIVDETQLDKYHGRGNCRERSQDEFNYIDQYNQWCNYCCKSIEGSWLQLLDLSDNNFQRIQSNSFIKISKCLNYLILKNNQIKEIESLAFNSLSDLKYLDISENNLTEFNFQLIKDLPIQNLNLVSNYLSSIIINNGIDTTLNTLNISNNLLTTFEAYDMHELEYLDLSHNKLINFNISTAPKLNTLDLSYNKFKLFAVSEGSFKNLNLSHNKIVNFSSCISDEVPKRLEKLDLSHNKISNLNSFCLPYLEILDLSHNNIKLISNMFQGLNFVRNINLQSNHLTTLPTNTFIGLDSLVSLDASQNYIQQLQYGSFWGINHLKELDLSFNKLQEIEFDKLLDLNQLQNLIIDNNNYNNLNLTDLIFKLPSLSQISLGHIPWKCKDLVQLTIALRKLKIEPVTKIHHTDFKSAINGIVCYSEDEAPQNLTYYESVEHIDESIEQEEVTTIINFVTSEATIQSEPKKLNTQIATLNEPGPLLELLKKAVKEIVEIETNKIKSDLTKEIQNSTWTILQKLDPSMQKINTNILIHKTPELSIGNEPLINDDEY